MRHLVCTCCGHKIDIETLPSRPSVECQRCGNNVPVYSEPKEYQDYCPKCGQYLDSMDLDVHVMACSGMRAHEEAQKGHHSSV